jgi:hypothetical protein
MPNDPLDSLFPHPSPLASLLHRCDAAAAHRLMSTLSNPPMDGRYPGTPGEALAANTVLQTLQHDRFLPLDELHAYCQPLSFPVTRFVRSPTFDVCGSSGAARLTHLRDYCVYVQGAAGGGQVRAPCLWLDTLQRPADFAPHELVAVIDGTSAGLDVTSSFHAYLDQLATARNLGFAALLRVDPVVDVRKAMIHARQTPSIPALGIAPAVLPSIFGTDHPPHLCLGSEVLLDVPIVDESISSAGNVVAQWGTGPVGLILTAHYDHLGSLPDGTCFPGASDNASGVAVVLGAARVLSSLWDRFPFRLVVLLTTGEEIGLVGARRFLDRFSETLTPRCGVLCVDEISGGARSPLYLLKAPGWNEPLHFPGDVPSVGLPVRPGRLRLDGYSDDVAFLERGFRRVAVLLSRDMTTRVTHTTRDTPDRIEPERLAAGMRALVLAALRMALRYA